MFVVNGFRLPLLDCLPDALRRSEALIRLLLQFLFQLLDLPGVRLLKVRLQRFVALVDATLVTVLALQRLERPVEKFVKWRSFLFLLFRVTPFLYLLLVHRQETLN